MKRDMDLIREILFEIERQDEGKGDFLIINLPPHSRAEIGYHLYLLLQAELVDGIDNYYQDVHHVQVKSLTWKGHDFLDDARDDTVWNKAKERTAAVGGTVSLAVLQALLTQVAKSVLGIP